MAYFTVLSERRSPTDSGSRRVHQLAHPRGRRRDAFSEQCSVIPALCDPTVIEDEDSVSVFHCRETVSDCERRSVLGEGRETFLNPHLGLGIDIADCLVQHEDNDLRIDKE
jgi:hypothetical protein